MKGRYFFYIPILLCALYLGVTNMPELSNEFKKGLLIVGVALAILSLTSSVIVWFIWYFGDNSECLNYMGPDRSFKEYTTGLFGTNIIIYILLPLGPGGIALYCFNRWLDKTFSTGKYKNKNK